MKEIQKERKTIVKRVQNNTQRKIVNKFVTIPPHLQFGEML